MFSWGVVIRVLALNLAVAAIVLYAARISLHACFLSDNSSVRRFGSFGAYVVAFFLGMLEWCWIAVVTMDPGSLDNQIHLRGVRDIEQFPPCRRCFLPKPPRCHHCSKCGRCILYMDHHCVSFGKCLAYRNFKTFLLVFFYGAAAAGFGSFVVFVCIFLDLGQDKLTQFLTSLFLAVLAAGMIIFARFYLDLKKNNVTTIEEVFGVVGDPIQGLPNVQVFEDDFRKFLPLPSLFNPFEPFSESVFIWTLVN